MLAVDPTRLVMREHAGRVAAGSLRDVQVAQLRQRNRAPLQPVGDHQPLRVFGPNGGHQLAGYRHVGFGLDFARLVHQVEAYPLVGNAFVARAKAAQCSAQTRWVSGSVKRSVFSGGWATV